MVQNVWWIVKHLRDVDGLGLGVDGFGAEWLEERELCWVVDCNLFTMRTGVKVKVAVCMP